MTDVDKTLARVPKPNELANGHGGFEKPLPRQHESGQ